MSNKTRLPVTKTKRTLSITENNKVNGKAIENYNRLAPVNVREKKQNRRTVIIIILTALYFAASLIFSQNRCGLSRWQTGGIIAAIVFYLASLSSLFNREVTIGMTPPVCFAALIFTVSRYWDGLKACFSGQGGVYYAVLPVVSVLAALSAVFIGIFAAMVISSTKTVSNGDVAEGITAVVPGCRLDGDRPGRILRRRLDAAKGFLERHPQVGCILSGGQVADEQCPEADAMRVYLIESGIPADRLFIENKSQTTYENIRFSKTLAEENGLPVRFAIVTDRFHQRRSQLICRDNGVECRAVNVSTPVCLRLQYWSREALCLAEKLVKGL